MIDFSTRISNNAVSMYCRCRDQMTKEILIFLDGHLFLERYDHAQFITIQGLREHREQPVLV